MCVSQPRTRRSSQGVQQPTRVGNLSPTIFPRSLCWLRKRLSSQGVGQAQCLQGVMERLHRALRLAPITLRRPLRSIMRDKIVPIPTQSIASSDKNACGKSRGQRYGFRSSPKFPFSSFAYTNFMSTPFGDDPLINSESDDMSMQLPALQPHNFSHQ